jgi:DDE family transposase
MASTGANWLCASRDFSIDWEQEQARCPQGGTSSSWTPAKARDQDVIKIKFAYTTCGPCQVRSQWTQSKRRTLTVRRREAYEALEAARQREQTEEFAQVYAQRAGIEGTHAEAGSPHGVAPFALYWRTANSSSARGHCHRHQCMSIIRVVDRRFSTSHASFAFCSLYERGCLMVTVDFATNINVRMSHFSLAKYT